MATPVVGDGYVRLIYSGGHTDLKIKSAQGLDDPERYQMWPPDARNTYLDGTKDTQWKGLRRKPLIDCGTISARADRIGLSSWMLDNDRTIAFNHGGFFSNSLSFVPSSPDVESTWGNGIVHLRQFVLDLEESSIRSEWPSES